LTAQKEAQDETARFLEVEYRGGDCFGRFSAGASGVYGWQAWPKWLCPGFSYACGKRRIRSGQGRIWLSAWRYSGKRIPAEAASFCSIALVA
jgi:hypothetical protein